MAQPSDSDWRLSVQQSNRNKEVREISKVLASLEPGATPASKLRLATQFEASVFSSADSFADYRKKLTKRLKKLQKNYVPPPKAAAASTATDIKAVLSELRNQYGEDLMYILKHADTAIAEMKSRNGEEKAAQLRQHTDGVKIWATDLGLLPGTEGNSQKMSVEQVEKLKGYLERKTENIRAHVVKLADTDRFLAETLAKKEKDFAKLESPKPSELLAKCTQRRFEHFYQQLHKTKPLQNAEELLRDAIEKAHATVPLPVRSNSQQRTGLSDSDMRIALKHLDKMRAASTVCLAYMSVPDKNNVPPSTLVKANQVVNDGTAVCAEMLKKFREHASDATLTLEDAWMKPLVLASKVSENVDMDEVSSPPVLRSKPYVLSRVLLTPNRKTPSNLLPALKRKGAKLIRPEPIGSGSHLILNFQCFVLTIYMVPLIATLRASNSDDWEKDHVEQQSLYWKPLHHGLSDEMTLEVWGATGTFETLGLIVRERLRDASSHATNILRQCFSTAWKAKGDFEIEIMEANALLEFIQLARTTYTPHWKEDE